MDQPVSVVDFSEFEHSKENIAPLKEGRTASKLAAFGAAALTGRAAVLEDQKSKWEDDIKKYRGDDPLDLWRNYIKWIQESFPSGGKQAGLINALERCTAMFKDSVQYKNDIRYLRLWVMYADLSAEPLEIFNFLKANRIGEYVALYYEAWAIVLETRRLFDQATAAYELGIRMNAKPVDRLRRHYTEFQGRMARRIAQQMQDGTGDDETAETDENRAPLQTLSSKQAKSSLRQGKATAAGLPRAAGGQTVGAAKKGANGPGFAIFVEDASDGAAPSADAVPGPWKTLGTESERKKENSIAAGPWNQPLPVSSSAVPPAAAGPAFTVYVDEEAQILQQQMAARSSAAAPAAAAAPVLSVRRQLDAVARPADARKKPASVMASASASAARGFVLNANERPGFDPSLIYTAGGEMSFEEARAACMAARLEEQAFDDDDDMMITRCVTAHIKSAPPTHADAMDAADDTGDVPKPKKAFAADDDDDGVDSEPAAAAPAAVAPTVPAAVGGAVMAPLAELAASAAPSDALVTPSLTAVSAARVPLQPREQPASTASAALPPMPPAPRIPLQPRPVESIKGGDAVAAAAPTPTPVRPAARTRSPAAPSFVSPTMTINSKLALAEVMDLICSKTPMEPPKPRSWVAESPASGTVDLLSPAITPSIDSKQRSAAASSFGRDEPPAAKPQFAAIDKENGPELPHRKLTNRDVIGVGAKAEPLNASRGGAANGSGSGKITNGDVLSGLVEFVDADDTMTTGIVLPVTPVANSTGAPKFQIYQDPTEVLKAIMPGVPIGRGQPADSSSAPAAAAAAPAVAAAAYPAVDKHPGKHALDRMQDGAVTVTDDIDSVVTPFTKKQKVKPASSARSGIRMNDSVFDMSPLQSCDQSVYSLSSESEPTTPGSMFTHRSSAFSSTTHTGAVSLCSFPSPAGSILSPTSVARKSRSRLGADSTPTSAMAMSVSAAASSVTSPSADSAAAAPSATGNATQGAVAVDLAAASEPVASESEGVEEGEAPYQVNPFEQPQLDRMLTAISPPLSNAKTFYDLRSQKAPAMPALDQAAARGKPDGGHGFIELDRCTLEVERCVGKGAFANVYLVHNVDTWDINNSTFALKVEKPPCLWEFYMCMQVAERVPANMLQKFPRVFSEHVYENKSFLLMDYGELGTLQDVINLYLKSGEKMPEPLVAYYTIEVLSVLETLHGAGIIHGDIKPDNFLLLNKECSAEWTTWPDSREAWLQKGLKLIDFGRSIDLRLYPAGTRFMGDCHADAFRCVEMQSDRPWTFQIDIFGVCAIAHCLLHGSYMETVQDPVTQRWRPKLAFKRYWDATLWQSLFDACLNIPDCDHLPDLARLRTGIEQWLLADPQRAKSIKPALAKQSVKLFDYRKGM